MAENFIRGYDFASAIGLKSGSDLEDLVTLAKFAAGSGALDQSTLDDDGSGKARVKTGGITPTQLAASAVTTAKLANGVLSADAGGQAKMANDYVLPAHLSWAARVPSATDIDACFAYRSTNQGIDPNVDTKINMDLTLFDPSTCFAGSRYTAKKAGIFWVFAIARMNALPASKILKCMIYGSRLIGGPTVVLINGTNIVGGDWDETRVTVGGHIQLGIGGYLEFWCNHDALTAKAIYGSGTATFMGVHLVARE